MANELQNELKKIPFEEEVWKPITHPHVRQKKYEISNYGNIVDLETKKVLPTWHLNGVDDFMLVVYLDPLSKDNLTPHVKCFVHELVAWEFCETCLDKISSGVIHKDFNPKNNYYKNLEWVGCKIDTSKKEIVYLACKLKQDTDYTYNKISKITGLSNKQLTKLYTSSQKDRHYKEITSLFNFQLKQEGYFDRVSKEERLIIQYLLALKTTAKDICKLLNLEYCETVIRIIEHQREHVKNKLKSNTIPSDPSDPKWEEISSDITPVKVRLAELKNAAMVRVFIELQK